MNVKQRILDLTDDGLEVFRYYFGSDIKPNKMFKSPLYNDTKASAHLIRSNKTGKYILKDHGNSEMSGDCFWLVSVRESLDLKSQFSDIQKHIIDALGLPIDITDSNRSRQKVKEVSQPTKTVKQKQASAQVSKSKKYSYDVKSWSVATLDFWGKYGISIEVLDKYGVRNIAEFTSVGERGPYTIKSSLTAPIFGYVSDNYVKYYRPFSEPRFLYAGQMPSSYVFGFKQLPQHGDVVFITGGEKDVLSLAAHGFNAICFNSETATIPDSTIENLRLRFRHIFLMYDCDETGIREMEKALAKLEAFDVMSLQLPLSGTKVDKDISDFFASGHTADDLHDLIGLALEDLYSDSMDLLNSCELDYDNPPAKSKVVISTEGVAVGSYDNLLCIAGGAGTGKSNFVSSLMAGALLTAPSPRPLDTLGFQVSPNFDSKAVLLFDTEQSEYQHFKNYDMALRRAALDKRPPFFHSFYLTVQSRKDRMKIIRRAVDLYHQRHKGVHLVIIDGVADMIRSVNDEIESVALVEELYRMAGIYHTCIICVLHYIPNGIKLRGHIGSELQRKAASILSLEKDQTEKEKVVVKAMKIRDGNPLEVPMLMFEWSKEFNMFVSAGQKSVEEVAKRQSVDLKSLAETVYEDCNAYLYKELVQAIVNSIDVAERTAKDYISKMYTKKYIRKAGDKYLLNIKSED